MKYPNLSVAGNIVGIFVFYAYDTTLGRCVRGFQRGLQFFKK